MMPGNRSRCLQTPDTGANSGERIDVREMRAVAKTTGRLLSRREVFLFDRTTPPRDIRIGILNSTYTSFTPLEWRGDSLGILDQRKLPAAEVWIETSDYRLVVESIRNMSVRGAPAIGIAGAYGLVLAAMELAQTSNGDFSDRLHGAARQIKRARPTGANLSWAIDRLLSASSTAQTTEEVISDLAREAKLVHLEDIDSNHRLGSHGAKLIPWGSSVLTHCNTGTLATGGYGTALGIIRTAWAENRLEHVYATETRPLLQGARLTALGASTRSNRRDASRRISRRPLDVAWSSPTRSLSGPTASRPTATWPTRSAHTTWRWSPRRTGLHSTSPLRRVRWTRGSPAVMRSSSRSGTRTRCCVSATFERPRKVCGRSIPPSTSRPTAT